MDKFLRRHKPQKLTKGEIENLNSPIVILKIECAVKKFSTKKTLGPDDFTSEFYQTFMKEALSSLYKLRKLTGCDISFSEANVTLITKPGKDITKRKVTDQYPHEQRFKNTKENFGKLNLRI